MCPIPEGFSINCKCNAEVHPSKEFLILESFIWQAAVINY